MPPITAHDFNQLAVVEIATGNLAAALAHAQEAVTLEPKSIAWRETLARVHYRQGDLPTVITIYEAIANDAPGHTAAWKRLTRLLVENWQFERADAAAMRALALDADDVQTLSMRVYIKHELGLAADAKAIAVAAAAAHPDVLPLALDAHLLLPMIYPDVQSLEECRAHYAHGLEKLHAEMPRWRRTADLVFNIERSNFLLAYQGKNDRELQSRYAALIGTLVEAAAPELKKPIRNQFDGTRKLKIGFVGKWFYSSTAGNYFERWITQLDPARFERHVYYTGQGEDELTKRIESASEHFTRLLLGPRANGQRILADQLDVLIHPEVGMSTGSYLLSAMRLAPVQIAAWGHPVTTGSSEIDYFLSCQLMEPENHAAHYSEKTILLDGIGVDLPLPTVEKKLPRAKFGLPDDAHLYFCPQSLFKIHPDMDDVFVKILSTDRRAVLVFFQADSRAITMAFANRLANRLERAGVSAKGQFKFLPRLNGSMFRSALALADVMLDTFHWSGGGTSLDAFAADVPVVTMPGEFMRGRQTMAMLRLMGLEQLIADDIDGYVAKAIELASNSAMSAAIRETIAAKKLSIFDRGEANAEFAERIYAVACASGERRW